MTSRFFVFSAFFLFFIDTDLNRKGRVDVDGQIRDLLRTKRWSLCLVRATFKRQLLFLDIFLAL